MSRRRFETVDRICRQWQKRYRRQKMGVMKKRRRPAGGANADRPEKGKVND